jgi:hypothetical protein
MYLRKFMAARERYHEMNDAYLANRDRTSADRAKVAKAFRAWQRAAELYARNGGTPDAVMAETLRARQT